jgi:hypothetical protein
MIYRAVIAVSLAACAGSTKASTDEAPIIGESSQEILRANAASDAIVAGTSDKNAPCGYRVRHEFPHGDNTIAREYLLQWNFASVDPAEYYNGEYESDFKVAWTKRLMTSSYRVGGWPLGHEPTDVRHEVEYDAQKRIQKISTYVDDVLTGACAGFAE